MTDESITAELRVKSCVIGRFPKPPKKASPYWKENTGEVWEIKADGVWTQDTPYPISLHFTASPGHPISPSIGKSLKITIEAL